MNTEMSDKEWIGEWSRFLNTIENLYSLKQEYLGENERKNAKFGHLVRMVIFLLDKLREVNQDDFYQTVLRETEAINEGREAIYITGEEMVYINQHYSQDNVADVKDANEGLEAAKTTKDSIEKMLHLPKWLKSILEGLNELLSLGRII